MSQFHTFVDFVLHVKGVEYLIAIGFLLTFIFFFRSLKTPAAPARAKETVVGRAMDYIRGLLVPEGIAYHQGHTWARLEGAATALVGLDDFATKLVGKIDKVVLPPVGAELRQGEKAWSLVVDGKNVDMVSPVNGKVIALNPRADEAVNSDPYGQGWLLKVESPKLNASARNLLTGLLAKKWTEQSVENLFARTSAQLGAVAADGGMPVTGVAKQIDAQHWDRIAREIFFTDN